MTQQTFDLHSDTDSGKTALSKVKSALQTLRAIFEGSSEPDSSVRVAGMLWYDSTSSSEQLKQRNVADTGWTSLWDPDEGPRFMVMTPMRVSNTDTLCFCAPFDCTILRMSYLPELATSSDGSNYYTFQVHNRTAANTLIASAPTTNGNDFVANTRWDLGVDQNLSISESDVLESTATVTGSPTSLSGKDVLVLVEYKRT